MSVFLWAEDKWDSLTKMTQIQSLDPIDAIPKCECVGIAGCLCVCVYVCTRVSVFVIFNKVVKVPRKDFGGPSVAFCAVGQRLMPKEVSWLVLVGATQYSTNGHSRQRGNVCYSETYG